MNRIRQPGEQCVQLLATELARTADAESQGCRLVNGDVFRSPFRGIALVEPCGFCHLQSARKNDGRTAVGIHAIQGQHATGHHVEISSVGAVHDQTAHPAHCS